MGVDMGATCAISIVRWSMDVLLVVHRELVPLAQFEERRLTLIKQFRVVAHVYDMLPYTTEIMRITENDPNAYAAIFTVNKTAEMYTIHEKSEEEAAMYGKIAIRKLHVNRTVMCDTVRDLFKTKSIMIGRCHNNQQDDAINAQYTSLKRIEVLDKDDFVYKWQKTDGNDHSFFSIGYALLATRMVSRLAGSSAKMPILVSSFKQIQRD